MESAAVRAAAYMFIACLLGRRKGLRSLQARATTLKER